MHPLCRIDQIIETVTGGVFYRLIYIPPACISKAFHTKSLSTPFSRTTQDKEGEEH